jgi:hypothetical protein
MTKARKLIVGLLMVSLLAVGVVALAENGFGGKGSADWAAARAAGDCTYLNERDSDGDGIANCDDPDWTRPLDGRCDGSGYGHGAHRSN